ncbi:MAG: thioesterase family protein [Polyangiaceae bacterium]|nr:thioesterase family protein [Polyangiaceae bacterium]
MSTFARATQLVPLGSGGYAVEIDGSWMQGRGVYGGLAAAILSRALEGEARAGQRLVRMTTSFVAPLAPGPCRVSTDIVRASRNVSTLRASLWNEGASVPAATCLATLARPRETNVPEHRGLSRPPAPPPAEVPDGPEELYFPEFASRFELRQCLGPRPFSGGALARIGGWCRLREPGPIDAALVVAVLDAWPPAAVGRAPDWCSVASLEMTVHFLVPLPLAPELAVRSDSEGPDSAEAGWLFHDATCDHVEVGLADERAVLYDPRGVPIATAQQLIALLPSLERPPAWRGRGGAA